MPTNKITAAQRKPTVEVKSFELCTFNGEMGKTLTDYLSQGWEMMMPPVPCKRGLPNGYENTEFYVQYFLILFKRTGEVATE